MVDEFNESVDNKKIPKNLLNHKVTVSYLGYTSQVLDLKYLNQENNIIKLETYIEELSEVEILIKDVNSLISKVFRYFWKLFDVKFKIFVPPKSLSKCLNAKSVNSIFIFYQIRGLINL